MKYGMICLEKHELMFSVLENQYPDTCLWSFRSIEWQLRPATNNYTTDLEGIKVASGRQSIEGYHYCILEIRYIR